MAEPDWSDWRKILETGKDFTAMTRAEAQQRAQELVREGQLAQERMQVFVDDLVRTSRKRADELVEVVRKEIQRQLEVIGIAPRDGRGKKKAAKKKTAKKHATDKKATKKKSKKKAPAKKKSAKAGTKKAATKKKVGARKPSGAR